MPGMHLAECWHLVHEHTISNYILVYYSYCVDGIAALDREPHSRAEN